MPAGAGHEALGTPVAVSGRGPRVSGLRVRGAPRGTRFRVSGFVPAGAGHEALGAAVALELEVQLLHLPGEAGADRAQARHVPLAFRV